MVYLHVLSANTRGVIRKLGIEAVTTTKRAQRSPALPLNTISESKRVTTTPVVRFVQRDHLEGGDGGFGTFIAVLTAGAGA